MTNSFDQHMAAIKADVDQIEAKAPALKAFLHDTNLRNKVQSIEAMLRELAVKLLEFNDCNREFWHGLPVRPSYAGAIPLRVVNALAELAAQPGLIGQVAKHLQWLLAEQNCTDTLPKDPT